MAIAKRAGKVLFYRLPSDSPEDQGVFHRMTNFTQAVTTKNPKEYTRQYVDEESQRVDVVGYASSTAYAFDLDPDNPVHQDLVAITDQEKIGPEAVPGAGAGGPHRGPVLGGGPRRQAQLLGAAGRGGGRL